MKGRSMTFDDLKKRIVIQNQEENPQLTRLFKRLSGKPILDMG
jgi:hypothetical protein